MIELGLFVKLIEVFTLKGEFLYRGTETDKSD